MSIHSNNAWVHVCYCGKGGDNVAELIHGRQDQRLLLFYDAFDAFLLNAYTNEWQYQARVTGDCQANSGFSQVGDSYLLYRLHLMPQQGLVDIQRNQLDHRLHNIKKV